MPDGEDGRGGVEARRRRLRAASFVEFQPRHAHPLHPASLSFHGQPGAGERGEIHKLSEQHSNMLDQLLQSPRRQQRQHGRQQGGRCTNAETTFPLPPDTRPIDLVPLLLSFGGVRAPSPPKLGGDVDTMSPDQHAQGKCRNPFYLPVSGSRARGTRQIVMSRTRHGALFSTFRRRILRGGYIAWRILRSGTLEGPAGWSFDPSGEGSMTTARPPLSLLICPCLSFCQRDCCDIKYAMSLASPRVRSGNL